MSAISLTNEPSVPAQRRDSAFYTAIAASAVLIAFGGFAATYWMQVPAGTFVGHPIVHLHAIIFSAWPLFFLLQTLMIGSGRVTVHRALGLAGISLATAMIFAGVAASIDSMNVGLSRGYGDAVRSFMIVPLSGLLVFATFVSLAIANISRPDWHKRFMIVATAFILGAAIARIFFLVATHGGGPGMRPGLSPPIPVSLSIAPQMIGELLVIAGMFYDWRTRGRPHPAYVIGFVVSVAVLIARVPLSATSAWLDATRFVAGF